MIIVITSTFLYYKLNKKKVWKVWPRGLVHTQGIFFFKANGQDASEMTWVECNELKENKGTKRTNSNLPVTKGVEAFVWNAIAKYARIVWLDRTAIS